MGRVKAQHWVDTKKGDFFAPNLYFIFVKVGIKRSNLQTFSSACPYCHGLACPRLQSQSCSLSQCPGCHPLRRSCGGRQLAPGSGKRATGSEGGPRCIHHAQARLRPPCHPPNATAPLEESRWEEQRGQMMRLWCSQETREEERKRGEWKGDWTDDEYLFLLHNYCKLTPQIVNWLRS